MSGLAGSQLAGQGAQLNEADNVSLIARAAATRQPVLANDVTQNPVYLKSDQFPDTRAELVLPMLVGSKLIGALDLQAQQLGRFSPEDVRVMRLLADQAAIAVRNAHLYAGQTKIAEELERRVDERTLELQRAKEHVEAIFNHSSDAILVVEADGAIRQVNPTFSELFGFPPDEVLGQSLMTLVETNDTERLTSTLASVVSGGSSGRTEIEAHRQDGTIFTADVGLSPLFRSGEGGAPLGQPAVVCSIWDITERKRMETGLRDALAKQKELSALKSRLVTTISHEFRTPLAIIQSSADNLSYYADRMTSEQKTVRMDKIHNQIHHMTMLLDDALALGQFESGMVEFDPKLLDLDELFKELVEDFRQAWPNHHLVYSRHGEGKTATGDRKLIQQIIINLLSNAAKYSSPGSTLSLDLTCGSDTTVFGVKDDGIGIPEKDHMRIFEAFHRASNVGTISGTGVGLAIVKHAVELQGGTIAVESQVGIGTTFTVNIPITAEGEPTQNENRGD